MQEILGLNPGRRKIRLHFQCDCAKIPKLSAIYKKSVKNSVIYHNVYVTLSY